MIRHRRLPLLLLLLSLCAPGWALQTGAPAGSPTGPPTGEPSSEPASEDGADSDATQSSDGTRAPEAAQESGDEPAAVAPASSGGASRLERKLESLEALQRTLEARREQREEARAAAKSLPQGPGLDDKLAEIQALQEEIRQLEFDYQSIATGIDVEAFEAAPPDSFNLQDEVQKLIQPLVEELKDATEAPRQIERLRSDIDYFQERKALAQEALDSIQGLLDDLAPEDPKGLRAGLEASRDGWKTRVEELDGQGTVARYQLDRRLSQQTSILETTQTALSEFFRTRGLNLVLAVSAFLLVLLLMRRLSIWMPKALPKRLRGERAFHTRLLNVLFYLFTGIFAMAAALGVLYATGDWVLLGLCLLFLLGVAWAFKTAIPMFLEQIRLLLNLGTVREREHLVVDGVPYRVSKLSFHTLLSNPDLAGGVRRLPLQDLIALRSRVCSKDEVWFPSKRGDWVLLSDGTRGEVTHQSPDMVQLQTLGGAHVTYPTGDYLALAPNNLSAGFRVTSRFGVDYGLQSIATTAIPEALTRAVEGGLAERFGEDALVGLRVEFCEAGSSSLDYLVLADMDGSAARHYDAVGRTIQRLCVETCTSNGWGIPFPQLTLHRADTEAAGG